MRTRVLVTTIALGACLSLSSGPAQAGLNSNGLNSNGLPFNGLTSNALTLNEVSANGWSHGCALDPSSAAPAASPDGPSAGLPGQRLSQQALGQR